MRTLLQNDLVSAVRGTDEEARLGGQGSGDRWAEGWKRGAAGRGTKEAEDSFAVGWSLSGAGGRTGRHLEPGRYEKDAGAGKAA